MPSKNTVAVRIPAKKPAEKTAAATAFTTEGHRLIVELRGTNAGIAKQLGVHKNNVQQWRSGAITPGTRMREKLERMYKISAGTWDRIPLGAVPSQPDNDNDEVPDDDDDDDDDTPASTVNDDVPDDEGDLDADWRKLIRAIRKQLDRQDILSRERMSLHEQLTKALDKRRRYQREREMTEDRTIREHPKWRLLKDTITDALIPFPEAARAVETAVLRLIGSSNEHSEDDEP